MASLRYFTLSVLMTAAWAVPQSVTESPSASSATSEAPSTITLPFSYPTPSGSILTITFPGSVRGPAPVVGRLIGTANALTTVAVTCPDYVSWFACPFLNEDTLTVGPSTLHYVPEIGTTYTETTDCSFSTGGGTCLASITGPKNAFITPTSGQDINTITGLSSSTDTRVYAASDIRTINVFITATGSATTSATGSSTADDPFSFSSSTASGTATTASSSRTTSVASPSTQNAAHVGVPDVQMMAGLLGGLAALLL